jgi:hypothetical protein
MTETWLGHLCAEVVADEAGGVQLLKVGDVAYVSPRGNEEQRWKAKQVQGV